MDLLYAWVASIASGIGPIIQYAEEHGFSPKSECHFTIIGRHMGDALMVRPQSVSTEERRLLEDRLHTLVLKRSAAYEWSVFHQPGVVDGLDEFYRQFSALMNIRIDESFLM
jgi:hypothetical protein